MNPDGSFFEFDSFPPETSGSWTPNDPLSGDDNNFFFEVDYGTSATKFLTISTPMTIGGQALPGWSSASTLTLVEFVQFTIGVPATNSPGHVLVAHFTFDDTNNPGVDSSGNDFSYNAGSGQNGGSVQGVSDAKIGSGALRNFPAATPDSFSCGVQEAFVARHAVSNSLHLGGKFFRLGLGKNQFLHRKPRRRWIQRFQPSSEPMSAARPRIQSRSP